MPDNDTQAPPAAVLATAPARELGHAHDASFDQAHRNRDLRFPRAYDTFDRMLEHPQVSSAFASVIMPILRTTWRIDGTGCDEEVTNHVAADMSLPIVGQGDSNVPTRQAEDRFSWGEHVQLAAPLAFGYGHAFFEQVAEQDEDGLWHLVKLGYRAPRTITKINTARDGGLVSIEQSPFGGNPLTRQVGSAKVTPMSVGRLVVYTHDRVGTNWRGRSMLLPAYMPWRTDLINRDQQRTLFDRHSSPSPVYEAAEGEKDLAPGRKIATAYRVGDAAGAAIPAGAKLHHPGIDGSVPDLDKALGRNNEDIARAFRAHFLNLGTATGTGSYALSNALQSFFTLTIQANAEEIARTGSRYIIRDIVDWNWGPGTRAPRLVFDEIGSRRDALVDAISGLVGAGVLKPDEELEQFLRTVLGLPPRDSNAPAPQEEAS